jgi:hypothetical protein
MTALRLGDRRKAHRAGAAIAFVLLLMLAFAALGHGLLVIALAEVSASSAGLRLLRARAAAEGAVATALRRPLGAWMDSVPVGQVRTTDTVRLGDVTSYAALRRVTREAWVVEGRGALPGRVEVRAAMFAWSLDPLERTRALGGVLNAPEDAIWAISGSVDAGAPTRVEPPLDSADCAAWLPELEAHYAAAPLVPSALLPDTVPSARLGPLPIAALLAATPVRVLGTGTPAAVVAAGSCVDDAPWGWGDPDDPASPCGRQLAMRGAGGDLTMLGGAGQGVLVVDGDLTLTSEARYYGLVLVTGQLRVDSGSSLEGLAVATAGGEVSLGAEVRGSACWAVGALAALREVLPGLVATDVLGPLGTD